MAKVICYDISGNTHEVPVKDLVWRPSIYGVLFDGSKVLLSKQWDGYDFPGGGVKIHETLDQALEREFFEETGLKVKKSKLVYCQTSFYKPRNPSRKPFNSILIYYIVEKISGELSTEFLDEHEKEYAGMPEWIEIDDFSKLKFYNSANNIKLIKEAFKINNQK